MAVISVDIRWEINVDNTWVSFPSWALFFISLGVAYADNIQSDHTIHLAVLTPVHNYAAMLIALGVVQHRAQQQHNAEAYFTELASCPIDTPVFLYSGNRRKKGLLKGVRCSRLLVQTQNERGGNLTEFISASNSTSIIIREDQNTNKLPKTNNGYRMDSVPEIWQPFSDQSLYGPSRMDINIIGNKNTIQTEASTPVKITRGQLSAIGTIQELLALQGISPSPTIYHGRFVSNTVRKHRGRSPKQAVTLFSDASSYTKAAADFSNFNSIAILNRLAPRCMEATYMFNSFYAGRTGDKVALSVRPPVGVEFLMFKEENDGRF